MGLTSAVLGLFFFLVFLILALLFLYKKLNRETDGEYTIQRIVFKEGGVRDQVRSAAITLGTHLGIQLWPDGDEEDEEAQNVKVEEEQEEGDSSQQDNDTDGENEQDGDSEDQSGSTKEKEGDELSLDSSEAGEQVGLLGDSEVRVEIEERKEEKQGSVEIGGGTGLRIDLQQFSGSAIWSEEDGGEGKSSDVTAL